MRQARNDARGAALGTLGLLVRDRGVATVARWPIWAALATASVAWAVVALGGYVIAKRLGFGGDDYRPASATSPPTSR
jgi:hypothetical protein